MGPTNEHPRTHRAVEACPRRASPHCPKHPHARPTPALSRPASALSSDGRSTPRPGRCGRRCRRPETPRIPSARIIVAGEGNPRPKRVWGAGIFAGKPAAILSPAARRARISAGQSSIKLSSCGAPSSTCRCRYSIAAPAPSHLALPSTDTDSTAAPSFTSRELPVVARPGPAPAPDGPQPYPQIPPSDRSGDLPHQCPPRANTSRGPDAGISL